VGEEPGRLTVDLRFRPPRRSGPRRGLLTICVVAAAITTAGVTHASAQVKPDTLRKDTIPADTLRVDTLAAGDTLGPARKEVPGDSASADTIFYNLPGMGPHVPAGWRQGVWVWEREDIFASGASTLVELLVDVPGVMPLLAGDYGTPVGLTAFGVGGGRVRILRDGFEVVPLEGGVADLARIGLVGISRVQLERSLGEVVIHLDGFEHGDGRTYSLVEAGTGDQGNNFFRGTFVDPVSLGGSAGVGLERTDARGARGNEAGSVTGSWLRYQLHRGNTAGLALDFRRTKTETAATLYASPVTRSDVTVRGRARVAEGAVLEAYWGKSTHDVLDEDTAYTREGGTRSQLGIRADLTAGPAFLDAAYRRFGGEDLPGARIDLEAGFDEARAGGLSASLARSSWAGEGTSALRLRGWTRPVLGLSAFGSWESGTLGSRALPLRAPQVTDTSAAAADTADSGPLFRVTDRKGTRLGAQWAWREFVLSGALLKLEADSLLPLGIEPDRGEPALAGGKRSGWEVWGRLPTPFSPLGFEGSLQRWEQDWSYLPRRTYTAAFVFHDTYLPSGNLEWWWTVGVRGHDRVAVRQVVGEEVDDDGHLVGPKLAAVPFYQNWYARIQLRIVSMRIFIAWENFSVRRNLQNYPDRLLPMTRAVYGIRWTLWN